MRKHTQSVVPSHRSLRYSAKRSAWFIYHPADARLKGRGKSILLYLPESSTPLINAWRYNFRPQLVTVAHEAVFVDKKGRRRKNLAGVVKSVAQRFPHVRSLGTAQGLRYVYLYFTCDPSS